jgi:hypothetical protein
MNVAPALLRALRHPACGVSLTLLSYMLLRRDVWGTLTRLPAATFESAFVLGSAMTTPLVAVTVVGAVVLAAVSWRLGYGSLAAGRWVRLFVAAIVIAQAWTGRSSQRSRPRACGVRVSSRCSSRQRWCSWGSRRRR